MSPEGPVVGPEAMVVRRMSNKVSSSGRHSSNSSTMAAAAAAAVASIGEYQCVSLRACVVGPYTLSCSCRHHRTLPPQPPPSTMVLTRATTSKYTTPEDTSIDDLQCQICLGTLTDCVTLEPCGHIYCAGCVSHHFAALLQGGQPLACPLRCTAPQRVVANAAVRQLVQVCRSSVVCTWPYLADTAMCAFDRTHCNVCHSGCRRRFRGRAARQVMRSPPCTRCARCWTSTCHCKRPTSRPDRCLVHAVDRHVDPCMMTRV